jgi:hypothetical protein
MGPFRGRCRRIPRGSRDESPSGNFTGTRPSLCPDGTRRQACAGVAARVRPPVVDGGAVPLAAHVGLRSAAKQQVSGAPSFRAATADRQETGSVLVEVVGGGGVEEPSELLDLVGCVDVALRKGRTSGMSGTTRARLPLVPLSTSPPGRRRWSGGGQSRTSAWCRCRRRGSRRPRRCERRWRRQRGRCRPTRRSRSSTAEKGFSFVGSRSWA